MDKALCGEAHAGYCWVMFTCSIHPRFSDTDALGHINNAVLATWFEEARRPIFKFFVPDLDPQKWNLILARVEVDFIGQMGYGSEVKIDTAITKIGRSSFVISHKVFQDGKLCARGGGVLVHFNYQKQSSEEISGEIRKRLEEHLEPSFLAQ